LTQQTDHSQSGAVNLPELLERLEDDYELLCELVAAFERTFPPQLQALQAAVARADMSTVTTASHTLKGMLAGLSVTRAATAAQRLEQMGRDGLSPGLAEALKVLEHEVANLLPELQTYIRRT